MCLRTFRPGSKDGALSCELFSEQDRESGEEVLNEFEREARTMSLET